MRTRIHFHDFSDAHTNFLLPFSLSSRIHLKMAAGNIHFHDLPDVILSNIFALLVDTRTRNARSLAFRKWLLLERSTRTSITLRGKVPDLFLIPTSFRAVTHLDLSLLSPWGQSPLDSSPNPVAAGML
uniref:Uncharacterized protein n=1 Tax=Nelumbo nucifera TaxID=4432 RepID=A0A822XL75_NELNU|nr:TPA_asm: hypothetical protein HUJ06_023827 [Nelumbo nucifera]